jgi:HAE1 family hydrophobic/amphiphilic exporter-1
MLFIGILGAGVFGLTQLGVDMYPDMDFPMIMVISSLEGAGPEEMEELVTDLLEQAVSRVSNVKNVTSRSMPGLSLVMAEFDWGHDLDQAETDVRRQLDMYEGFLPEDAAEPTVLAMDPSLQPVIFLGFTSETLSEFELRRLVEDEIESRLSRVEGVGSVSTLGGLRRQINVTPYPSRLAETGLSLSQVVGALQSVRNNTPAGYVDAGGMRINLRVESAFETVGEIEQLVVGYTESGPVELRHVADVEDGREEKLQYVRFGGRSAVMSYINKRSDANTVNVTERVHEVLAEIESDYEGQLELQVMFEQAEFINQSIGNLGNTAVQAVLFAFVVLLFFLRSWRGASVAGVAIPISVFVTFFVMHLAEVQINVISLAGLALAIGLLVDNSVVVLENVFRHREMGKSIWDAAVDGASEVSMAITASTMTTLAVFLPILFVPGLAGQLFREMVLTITFSLSVSLFVALSLVPLISSWVRRLVPDHERGLAGRISRLISEMQDRYNGIVSWAVGRKKVVLGAAGGAFALSVLVATMLPTDFFPETDDAFLSISLEEPVGTDLETTNATVAALEDSIRAIVPEEDLLAIFSSVGQGEGIMAVFGSSGTNEAEVNIRFTPSGQRSTSIFDYEDEIRKVLDGMPGIEYQSTAGGTMMTGSPIEVEIYGDDLGVLSRVADRIKAEMQTIEGAVDVQSSVEEQVPEYSFDPSPARLSLYGASPSRLARDLSYGLMGTAATVYREGDEEYDVFVRYPQRTRDSREDVETATVLGRPLSAYGELRQRMVPNTIRRKNQSRMARVSCDVYGRSLGEVAGDVSAMLDTVDTAGYRVEVGGEMEDQRETFMYLGIAIAVAAALVYMVMAGQFESFLEPFIIIFTIPLAVIGVVLALLVTGTTLSVMSLVGVLMLAGIVVNNGIVMVDYANQLRGEGRELEEAIVEASTIRMRPILMTAFTTILAMFPLALEIGEGSESWSPMAISVIGGLFVATMLTLLVEPCIYVVFGRYKAFRRNRNGDSSSD